MAAKRTRLTHKIALQLHLVAESCTICSSGSRRPVRKLLDTPSYLPTFTGRRRFKFFLRTCCQLEYVVFETFRMSRRRRDSSVVYLQAVWLEVRVRPGAGNFSLHNRVQTGSGAHPAYLMGTRGSFPGDKAAGALS
jgi:hypothetical protein